MIRIPSKLQAFKIAEIAKYSAEERQKYIDSLKHYLDLKNSFETAEIEGIAKGKKEREREIVIELIKNGVTDNIISISTKLSIEEINEIRYQLDDK